MRSGTYTYSGTAYSLCHLLCKVCRNLLQYYTETSCFVKCLGVGNKFFCLSIALGTQTISTKLVYALRSKSKVSANWYACVHHSLNHWGNLGTAFNLYGVNTCFFHYAYSVAQTFFCRNLVAAERHIAYNKCVVHGTGYRACVVYHLVYSDRKSGHIAIGNV